MPFLGRKRPVLVFLGFGYRFLLWLDKNGASEQHCAWRWRGVFLPTAHGRYSDAGLAGRMTATTLETLVVDQALHRDPAPGPNVQTLANDLFRAA
jgi:hypothetical protein